MPFTLATFNVKDLFLPRCDAERLAFSTKLGNVADLIARADADVVALQEIGSNEAVRQLLMALGGRGRYGAQLLGAVDARGIGNALLARVPVLGETRHTADRLELPVLHRGDPPPFGGRLALRRGVLHARVDAGAGIGAVHVMVVHFKSKLPLFLRNESGATVIPTTPRGWAEAELRSAMWRSAEALHVRGLVDDVLASEPDAHVAVAGDLNDTAGSLPVRVLTAAGHRSATPLPGVLHTCADVIPEASRYSVIHGGQRAQIDHVLVTSGLRTRMQDARILNETLRDHGPFEPDPASRPPSTDSDHAPLVVRFA